MGDRRLSNRGYRSDRRNSSVQAARSHQDPLERHVSPDVLKIRSLKSRVGLEMETGGLQRLESKKFGKSLTSLAVESRLNPVDIERAFRCVTLPIGLEQFRGHLEDLVLHGVCSLLAKLDCNRIPHSFQTHMNQAR